MNYLITPPNTHYDGGLGITACDFLQAADALREIKEFKRDVLPLCYLQRHAIELFLKSFIVILHKKYKIPYGEDFSVEKPGMFHHGKWIPLSSTHNLSDLFSYFHKLFIDLTPTLPSRTNWTIEADIGKKINLVSGSDPKSTYFRYPESTNSAQDAKKSSIQPQTIESVFENIKLSEPPVKSTLLIDQDDNIIQAYKLNHSPIPEILAALHYLSKYFYNMHAAFRFEITKGF
jgi:hypothetical protein